MWVFDHVGGCAVVGGEEDLVIREMLEDAWVVRGVVCGVLGEKLAKGEAPASYPLYTP